ncbi:hypothetical protein OIU84_021376 [Salix udensis]|uniref:GH16 domain-containing protein n=1 Tax=Salix udensis TaxID=889485 RepID=A0AAD6KUI3_9ROSI|nr:hypothetical protein OIU84_021376 [Salix udensis]
MACSYLAPCSLLICSLLALLVSGSQIQRTLLPIISFDEGYTQLFGDDNLVIHRDGKTVHLSLDERTGSGFVSQDLYLHGYFSASIKLPADYTAGVVVAFYMSNGDIFEKNHDEIDFEFLGNIRGKDWRIQTNIYGNGSTSVGREERYSLWFDPSEDFHQYSILWTDSQIIFYVDNIPIREVKRTESMGGDFLTNTPLMSLNSPTLFCTAVLSIQSSSSQNVITQRVLKRFPPGSHLREELRWRASGPSL